MSRGEAKIGLHQAMQLCNMSRGDCLVFLAKGLPIIQTSALSMWAGSLELEKDRPREAAVLRTLAEEEAAKVLVLMDAVRCPARLFASRVGKIVEWSYSHLSRLIYATAIWWQATSVAQLREFVDTERTTHYLEGFAGEFIVPNLYLYKREGLLYADVEADENGDLSWSDPLQKVIAPSWSVEERRPPESLLLTEALDAMGVFTLAGLQATSKIWGQVDFTDPVRWEKAVELGEQLVDQLRRDELPHKESTEGQASWLVNRWQMPMYNLDHLSPIPVSMKKLEGMRQRTQEAIAQNLW